MPFIPITNCAQVELFSTFLQQKVENVFHIQSDIPLDEPSLIDMTSTLIDWWDVRIQPIVSMDVLLERSRARDLTTDGAIGVEVPVSPALQGTAVGDSLPSHTALAIKWNTGHVGRSYRGRTFHFGFVESQVTGNHVGAMTVTALSDAYNGLITDVAAASTHWKLVVASRYHNRAPRVLGVTTPIITATVDAVVDTQRRRGEGRGR